MRLLVMVVVVFAVFPLVYWLLTKINSRVASEADEGSLPGQVAKAGRERRMLVDKIAASEDRIRAEQAEVASAKGAAGKQG